MTERVPNEKAIFDAIVADFGPTLSYEDEGGYFAVDLSDDIETILKLYTERLSDLKDTIWPLKPDQADLNFMTTQIEDVLNTTLHDLHEGDTVSTTSPAMCVYEDIRTSQFVVKPLGEFQSIVGTYRGIVIANMPTWDPTGEMKTGEIEFVDTPSLLIEYPYVVAHDGENEYLATSCAIISLSSPLPTLVKRLFREGGL